MRRLSAIGIVCVGLLIAMQSIGLLTSVLSGMASPGFKIEPLGFSLLLIPILTPVAFGTWLVLRRGSISARLFEDEPLAVDIDAPSGLRLGLVLIGVWLVAGSAPDLLYQSVVPLAKLIQTKSSFGEFELVDYSFWYVALPRIVAQLLFLGIGICLLAFSRSIATRLWFGRVPVESPQDVGTRTGACPECGAAFDPGDYAGGLATPRCTECGEPLDLRVAEQAPQPDAPEVGVDSQV